MENEKDLNTPMENNEELKNGSAKPLNESELEEVAGGRTHGPKADYSLVPKDRQPII